MENQDDNRKRKSPNVSPQGNFTISFPDTQQDELATDNSVVVLEGSLETKGYSRDDIGDTQPGSVVILEPPIAKKSRSSIIDSDETDFEEVKEDDDEEVVYVDTVKRTTTTTPTTPVTSTTSTTLTPTTSRTQDMANLRLTSQSTSLSAHTPQPSSSTSASTSTSSTKGPLLGFESTTSIGLQVLDILRLWKIDPSSDDKVLKKFLYDGDSTPMSKMMWNFLLGKDFYVDNYKIDTIEAMFEILLHTEKTSNVVWKFNVGVLLIQFGSDQTLEGLHELRTRVNGKVGDFYMSIIEAMQLYKIANLPGTEGLRSVTFKDEMEKRVCSAVPELVRNEIKQVGNKVKRERVKWIQTLVEMLENILASLFNKNNNPNNNNEENRNNNPINNCSYFLAWASKYMQSLLCESKYSCTPFSCIVSTYRITCQSGCADVTITHSGDRVLHTSIFPPLLKINGISDDDAGKKNDGNNSRSSMWWNLHKHYATTVQDVLTILHSTTTATSERCTVTITNQILNALYELEAEDVLKSIQDNAENWNFENNATQMYSQVVLKKDNTKANLLALEISKQKPEEDPFCQMRAVRVEHFNTKQFLLLLSSHSLGITEEEKLLLAAHWICSKELGNSWDDPQNDNSKPPKNETSKRFDYIFDKVKYRHELLKRFRDLGKQQYISWEFFFDKTETEEF